MFAALVLEREPPTWLNLPRDTVSWVQDVGGWAAAGIAVWLLATGFRALRRSSRTSSSSRESLFLLATTGVMLVYGAIGLLKLPDLIQFIVAKFEGTTPPEVPMLLPPRWLDGGLTLGGAFAILAVLIPFVSDFPVLRFRRIWALALLTIKEVVRRRIFWVFALLAVVFLFATWFIDVKAEKQVETYVGLVYLAIAVLVVLTGGLLASFTIPTDIRQLTIHTIVTKPVERFEVVLGRFLGHAIVMTIAIFGMAGLSLVYVLREIPQEAKDESMKARVPITGELEYVGTDNPTKGTSVGDEWEYRGYISGPMPNQPTQYAVWYIRALPASLAARQEVPCEFTFSIYRTTTGEEAKGVFATFTAESFRWHPGRLPELEAERKRLQREGEDAQAIDDRLAEKYGYYQFPFFEVKNFHTQGITIPGGVFRNHLESRTALAARLAELKEKRKLTDLEERQKAGSALGPAEVKDLEELRGKFPNATWSEADEFELAALEKDATGGERPPFKVRVKCESRTQFLGMAKYDLYLLSSSEPFWVNFFKGTVGIWCWTVLVIGVAVAVSTYCSGPITWLVVMFLFFSGVLREWVTSLAAGKNEGGGPLESMVRLLGRQTVSAELGTTTVTQAAEGSDEAFRWVMRRMLNLIPDVYLFDFTGIVASGFDVSLSQIVLTLIYLAGYLLPWAVLAYYLMKTREIATW